MIPQSDDQPYSFSIAQLHTSKRLTREEATETFRGLGDSPYDKVSLGGCAIGDSAAAVVAEELVKLASFHSLKHLSLADCFATLGEAEAIRALSVVIAAAAECAEISCLDLSQNALGSLGISACAALFQSRRHCLRHLYLSRAGLSPESMRLIRSFVATRGPTHIEVLHLDGNMLSSQGVKYVADIIEVSPLLKDISLAAVRADKDAILRVLTSLSAHTSMLERLDLSDNACDSMAALGFANVFCANTNLRKLVLRDMNMKDDAASLLLRAIASAPIPIEVIDLGGNELSSSCAISLAVCTNAKASTLLTLNLEDNELGDIGVSRLEENLSTDHSYVLENVSLAQNAISDLGAINIATGLVALPRLKSLNLEGNSLLPKTVAALKEVFAGRLAAEDDLSVTEVHLISDSADDPLAGAATPEITGALSRLSRAAASRTSSQGSELVASKASAVSPSRSYTTSTRPAGSLAAEASNSERSDALTSSTPFLTPVKGKPNPRESDALSGGRLDRGRVSMSSDAVVSSARELREQVNSLDIEVSSLVEELRAEIGSPEGASGLMTVESQAPQSGGIQDPPPVKPIWNDLVNAVWAFIFAALLLMIFFSLVQSQDEYTFSLKPI